MRYSIFQDEQVIIDLLNSENESAINALESLFIHFDSGNELLPSIHTDLIWTIYVKQVHESSRQLSIKFQLEEKTLYRYRKKYIDFFKFLCKDFAA